MHCARIVNIRNMTAAKVADDLLISNSLRSNSRWGSAMKDDACETLDIMMTLSASITTSSSLIAGTIELMKRRKNQSYQGNDAGCARKLLPQRERRSDTNSRYIQVAREHILKKVGCLNLTLRRRLTQTETVSTGTPFPRETGGGGNKKRVCHKRKPAVVASMAAYETRYRTQTRYRSCSLII